MALEELFNRLLSPVREDLVARYGVPSLGGTELAREFFSHFSVKGGPWDAEEVARGMAATREGTLLEEANRLLDNQVMLLGTRVELGATIDWFHVPDRDQQWTVHLGRHYWLAPLAFAWSVTRDALYAGKLLETLLDFLKNVPPDSPHLDFPKDDPWVRKLADRDGEPEYWEGKSRGYTGGAWTSLSAHIRVDWWTRFFQLIWDAPCFTNEKVAILLNSLFGPHLSLMRDFPRQMNQYQGIASSLVGYGFYYSAFQQAAKAEALGWRRLNDYVHREIYPDGSMAECSFNYSFKCFQRLCKLADQAERGGRPSLPWKEALGKAVRYFALTATPTGDKPGLAKGAGPIFEDLKRLTLAENDPVVNFVVTKGKLGRPPSSLCNSFPWAGHHALRSDWSEDAIWLFFENGSRGTGHYDCSKLGIQLMAFREWLLVDPGFYTYSTEGKGAAFARYLHSSAAHNVAIVDGCGQVGPEIGATRFPNNTPSMDLREQPDGSYFLAGIYNDGFAAETENSVTHTRQVVFRPQERSISIQDTFIGDNRHSVALHWQLAPGLEIVLSEKCFVACGKRVEMTVRFESEGEMQLTRHHGQLDPPLGWYSGEYGHLEPITTVRLRVSQALLPLRISSTIEISQQP